MLELMIASMCLNSLSYGACDEAGRAYILQPHIKKQVRVLRKTVTKTVGPTTMQVVPTIAALAQGQYSARVYPNIYLNIKSSSSILTFKYEF